MNDTVALRYRDRDVVFEKSATLIAARARAGMVAAMEADIDTMAINDASTRRQAVGAFEVVELRLSASGVEQDLDWLRARPSVAAETHVFRIQGETALIVPNGYLHLRFERHVAGHVQQATLNRYRLQMIEQRGDGDYLLRITSGSKNPLVTAAALQAEAGVALAEPEFVDAG